MSSIKVKSKLEELYRVHEFVNNIIHQEKMEIDLIVEEIFVNITQYSQSTYTIVNTEFNENTGVLTLEFVDDGTPFNPLEKEDPVKPDSVEEANIGGLGIHFIKNLADKVEYEYVNNENHLKIAKKVK